MNGFILSIFLIALLLAILGWTTHLVYARWGNNGGRLFRTGQAYVLAGLILFLVMLTNYWLASTAIGRTWGKEGLGKDAILGLFIEGAPTRSPFEASPSTTRSLKSNSLMALVVVATSLLAAATLLHAWTKVVEALQRQRQQREPADLSVVCGGFIMIAAVALIVLGLDTAFLALRSAQMMWPDEMARGVGELPDILHLLKKHDGTMAAFLLRLLILWYPTSILLVEKHFSSCWAAFNVALADYHRQLAMAEAQQGPYNAVHNAAVPPIRPRLPVIPPAPQAHTRPAAVPAFNNSFVPPVPGGAAPWVRPIPFNAGPQVLNDQPR